MTAEVLARFDLSPCLNTNLPRFFHNANTNTYYRIDVAHPMTQEEYEHAMLTERPRQLRGALTWRDYGNDPTTMRFAVGPDGRVNRVQEPTPGNPYTYVTSDTGGFRFSPGEYPYTSDRPSLPNGVRARPDLKSMPHETEDA